MDSEDRIISIEEACRIGGFSRSSFYRHFHNLYFHQLDGNKRGVSLFEFEDLLRVFRQSAEAGTPSEVPAATTFDSPGRGNCVDLRVGQELRIEAGISQRQITPQRRYLRILPAEHHAAVVYLPVVASAGSGRELTIINTGREQVKLVAHDGDMLEHLTGRVSELLTRAAFIRLIPLIVSNEYLPSSAETPDLWAVNESDKP